jgi:GrpB-like predicted nucleotidyltransferase (UPF0157 family)
MVKLILKRHDPRSKRYFASERKYLLKKLDKKLIFDIIHFGSTAVPGLGGKGMIDIFLIAKSKKAAMEIISQIKSYTDYDRPATGGSKERIFHRRTRKIGGKKVTFHLHVSWKSAKGWKNDILFLNYLLKHPEAARRYGELKYIWAEKAGYVRRKYHDSKPRFISMILKKAKCE